MTGASAGPDRLPLAGPEERVAAILAAKGIGGSLHAVHLGSGAELAWMADEPVVTASVFKIAVLVELYRQAAAGELDLTARITVSPADRVFGSTGLSVLADGVEMSLRDLATLMMSLSDNTATDVVLHRVGLDRVNATLRHLGLNATRLRGTCADLLAELMADIGLGGGDDPARFTSSGPLVARALDPQTTSCSTARETTRLLAGIWADQVAPPHSCAAMRSVLQLQPWANGLRAALRPGERFAGKSGTLPGIRNEAGVITGADGSQIAIAVFTRRPTTTLVESHPEADEVLARLGRLAVDTLTGAPD